MQNPIQKKFESFLLNEIWMQSISSCCSRQMPEQTGDISEVWRFHLHVAMMAARFHSRSLYDVMLKMHLVCLGLREGFLRRPEFELNLQLPRKWENNNNVGCDHMLWCEMRAPETGRLNHVSRRQHKNCSSVQAILLRII